MSQSSKPSPFRLSLAVLMAITLNAPLAARADSKTDAANHQMMGWLDSKETKLAGWLGTRDQKSGYIPNWGDFSIIQKDLPLSPMTDSESRIAANTKALYDEYFPKEDASSLVGTFVESGNPHVNTARGPYQWDSQKAAGLDEPGVFDEVIKNVVKSNIKSIRIGPNLFEIKNGLQSWSHFIEKIDSIWEAGATPTISVAFFPSLERWKVLGADGKVDESKSFLLNPQWPADMAAMTSDLMDLLNAKAAMYERHHNKKARFVINPINEPETLAGFNRQFWHGAYANWGSPLMMKYYVPSVINIARANVAIRQAVEKKSHGERILFMHNEAMTPTYYPSHKGPGRFAVSKFMLGDDLVLKTNFDEYLKYVDQAPIENLKNGLMAEAKSKSMNEIHWAFKEYVFGTWNTTPDMQKAALKDLVAQFKDLQKAHLQFASITGKTMKTDNMLLVDYYYQTEFILNRPVPQLATELSANGGALLKKVLDAKEDATVVRMMRTAVLETKKDLPMLKVEEMDQLPALFAGVDVDKLNLTAKPGENRDVITDTIAALPEVELSSFDLQKLLSAEDYFLFYKLIGIRNEFAFAKDSVTTARRAKFKEFAAPLKRTDELMADLLAGNGRALRQVLNAPTDQQLMQILEQAGQDTRDKGPVVTVSEGDSLRQILNKSDRRILERLFGMTREQLLGFEPEHYARHIRLGIRDGFYKFAMQYVNNLRLHAVGVGESGTPFYVFAPILHDQVMMEYAHVLKSGVYGTQYAFGPALDTKGWAKGPLSLHYADDHETNPSGMFSLIKGKRGTQVIERSFRPGDTGWARTFLGDFFSNVQGK